MGIKISYQWQKRILIIGFLVVPIVLLILFSYVPLLNMVYYSFTKWNGMSPKKEWVGFDNYVRIITRPEYFKVFTTSLYYLIGSFVQMALALYFATILSYKIIGKNFFKGVLFFPYLLNGVAISFIFWFFYLPNGTLDTLLSFLGLSSFVRKWLGDPSMINISLASTSVWRYMGFNFIVFIGAIASIPKDVYEAADIDGANQWHQFRYIIFPSIVSIVELNLILSVKGAISVFEIPYIMTAGGNGSMTFVIQTVTLAFQKNKVGLASAMAVLLMLIIIISTWIQRRYFERSERKVGKR